MLKKSLLIFLMALQASCATYHPIDTKAADQFREVGTGYGVVVKRTFLVDDAKLKRLCAEGGIHPYFKKYCGHLDEYVVYTVNVAATTNRSFLKAPFILPASADVREGDIVQFRFEDWEGFIRVASRGERENCRWGGDSKWLIVLPGQEGGIECDGWSYKSVLHIDWLNR